MIIENGVIISIGQSNAELMAEECKIIALENRYLMPGVIDCHVHFMVKPTTDFEGYLNRTDDVDFVITAIENLEKYLIVV
jgi:imidazolonepropionase-like amidohydrolase